MIGPLIFRLRKVTKTLKLWFEPSRSINCFSGWQRQRSGASERWSASGRGLVGIPLRTRRTRHVCARECLRWLAAGEYRLNIDWWRKFRDGIAKERYKELKLKQTETNVSLCFIIKVPVVFMFLLWAVSLSCLQVISLSRSCQIFSWWKKEKKELEDYNLV